MQEIEACEMQTCSVVCGLPPLANQSLPTPARHDDKYKGFVVRNDKS
jgi:hypothetical protein